MDILCTQPGADVVANRSLHAGGDQRTGHRQPGGSSHASWGQAVCLRVLDGGHRAFSEVLNWLYLELPSDWQVIFTVAAIVLL